MFQLFGTYGVPIKTSSDEQTNTYDQEPLTHLVLLTLVKSFGTPFCLGFNTLGIARVVKSVFHMHAHLADSGITKQRKTGGLSSVSENLQPSQILFACNWLILDPASPCAPPRGKLPLVKIMIINISMILLLLLVGVHFESRWHPFCPSSLTHSYVILFSSF